MIREEGAMSGEEEKRRRMEEIDERLSNGYQSAARFRERAEEAERECDEALKRVGVKPEVVDSMAVALGMPPLMSERAHYYAGAVLQAIKDEMQVRGELIDIIRSLVQSMRLVCVKCAETGNSLSQWCPLCKGPLAGGTILHQDHCPIGKAEKVLAGNDPIEKVKVEQNDAVVREAAMTDVLAPGQLEMMEDVAALCDRQTMFEFAKIMRQLKYAFTNPSIMTEQLIALKRAAVEETAAEEAGDLVEMEAKEKRQLRGGKMSGDLFWARRHRRAASRAVEVQRI